MLFIRQIWTLIWKNILLVLLRQPISTTIRAFLLPCIFTGFLAYARNLFLPPSVYGIGSPTPVRTLHNALDSVAAGRNKLVFVNNGFTGGAIEQVIHQVEAQTGSFGGKTYVLEQEEELLQICRSTIRATSNCIAGAVFWSSPSEGPGGHWNYSLRADGALQTKIVTDSHKNDAEIYLLPLQHAIDSAISSQSNGDTIPKTVDEYIYTSETAAQRREHIRVRYMGGIIKILAVAFEIGMVCVTYQLTGLIANEREIGMAQLLDATLPNLRRWQPQMARILANHIAFDMIYGPGWIVMAIILSIGVFTKTSAAIMIIENLLSGLAMSSMTIFSGAFFKKAQLSGITTVIVSMLLAVIAQVASKAGTASVTILSLLFPPMNYVYFIILMARWERQDQGTNLIKSAPENTSALPGIVLWIFTIIHIIAFPILGAWVERTLYGTTSKERRTSTSDDQTAVTLNNFTKEYPPTQATQVWSRIMRKPTSNVLAVNNLSLQAMRGQIMVLLGANGSGKSTTLDAIAGLNSITSGSIDINFTSESSSLGLCPQKNVLWDDVTVQEHLKIFNALKSPRVSSKEENLALLSSCDILPKLTAKAKTLSGGQKRKLQLAMMFTGGSSVCCVDEVSSGLDPLSRRKIWDILLAERGRRSIILTTHFLDEADLLADHIAILSKGNLKAVGTSVELKHKLGSGYRVHVYHILGGHESVIFDNVPHTLQKDQTTYMLSSSKDTSALLRRLEDAGITEYQVSGPTIEDVFLKVAEEIHTETVVSEKSPKATARASDEDIQTKESTVVVQETRSEVPQLLTGRRISIPRQVVVLFGKRWTILRRNPLPYLAALLIPITAAGLVTLYLNNFQKAGCDPLQTVSPSDVYSLAFDRTPDIVAGPSSRITNETIAKYVATLDLQPGTNLTNATLTFASSLHLVDTVQDFNNYIHQRFANVTPGGFFLGEAGSNPLFAWQGDNDISFSTTTQNVMNNFLSNVSITNQYQSFDIPWAPDTGNALQLITYFGLAMAAYPAFFALYPTIERLRNVRGLHYSNGVRSAPLWLAYTIFDFIIVLISSAIAIIIFRAVTNIWYHIEYLFVVLFLYGLASTLLSYVISLFSRSQLAAFAFAAGGQAVVFLLYFIAFMSVLTYSPINEIDRNLDICHFTIAIISPVANLTRALFVTLNVFSVTCRGHEFASYPGSLTAYGGPILYLIVQSFILFGMLLLFDSGSIIKRFRARKMVGDAEEVDILDAEVSNELTRVTSSRDGLRVMNISKKFRKNLAVNNVTFGVPHGEVFALLGPNGAGKSTLISLIRGDLQPTHRGGDIIVEDTSVIRHRAHARARLGVCPQFDAMDRMTVQEHLHFYAKARGVDDPTHNVQAVMQAVSLEQYAHRMAEKLSGGNKRKLSLGIALMGNPSVLLLDEPSSGMDAASKRVMWRTLASVVPGRSLVLTTHSMEEADALATRAGILASKMLALGTTDYLRRKHGDAYHVHLAHQGAPHSSEEDMARIRSWIVHEFPSAEIENKVYGGQLRFSLPITKESNISILFSALEDHRQLLEIAYYSVSRATLDQVFLSIVGKHNVEEEGGLEVEKSSWRQKLFRFKR